MKVELLLLMKHWMRFLPTIPSDLVLDGQLVVLIDFHIGKLKNLNILFFGVCLIIWKMLNYKLISSSTHK